MVKFVKSYSIEVHKMLAFKQIATIIHHSEKLAGGWIDIIMDEV